MKHYVTIGDWRISVPRPITDAEVAELQQIVLEQSHDAMIARLREMTEQDWKVQTWFVRSEQ